MSPRRLAAIFLTLTFLLPATSPLAALAADDPLVVTDCTYGDAYQFTPAGCVTSIENKSATPLMLAIKPVQPGNTVEPNKLTLAPHTRAKLSLHVLTDNIAGAVTWTYRIEGSHIEPHFVNASGFVSSVLDVGHPEINFGAIDPTTLPALRTIALTSSLDPKVRLTQILSSPPMLRAVIGPDRKSLTIEMGSDASWGSVDGIIKVALDHAQQKQAWVHVTGSMIGDIGPPDNPHWVGEITRQPKTVLTVPLVDRQNRDFSIGKVTSADFAAAYDGAPCEPARAGCRNLLIHVSDSQPAGFFKSNLDVSLPDRKKHLIVAIWGVLGERPKPGEAALPPEIKKVPLPASLTDDGVTALPPLKVQSDPPGSGPLLKWTIEQQQSVYGYQVLRGNSAEGPFELMEPHLIAKLDNGKGPVAYRWRDTSAVKGQTYWYYIAVLYSSGDRRPLSDPQKTLAK